MTGHDVLLLLLGFWTVLGVSMLIAACAVHRRICVESYQVQPYDRSRGSSKEICEHQRLDSLGTQCMDCGQVFG
jgi:hypothetical protein